MKNGFTIIEMLVVIALASMLLMLLFGSFIQSNKLVRTADDYITLYTKVAIAHHQLDKDMSGACVPLQLYAQEKKAEHQKEAKEKEAAPVTKLFVATTQDKQLDMFTCISNNPLQAYWSERIGKPQPHLVRIVYRLIKDEEDDLEGPPSFKLLRQSDSNLDFDAYKTGGTIREYELLSRIKSMSLSFKAIVETEEGTEKKISKELKNFNIWDSDTEDIMSNNRKKYIPNAVTVTLVVWDDQKQQEQEFIITILIPADSRVTYAGEQVVPSEKELKKKKSLVRLPKPPSPRASPRGQRQ